MNNKRKKGSIKRRIEFAGRDDGTARSRESNPRGTADPGKSTAGTGKSAAAAGMNTAGTRSRRGTSPKPGWSRAGDAARRSAVRRAAEPASSPADARRSRDGAVRSMAEIRREPAARRQSAGTRAVSAAGRRSGDAESRGGAAVGRGNASGRRPMTEADMHRRIEQTRQRARRRTNRIRAVVTLVAAAAAAVILMFMTPIFDIKQIALEGNNSVTKEQIEEKVGSLIGANLFSSTGGRIREMVMEIPQIEDVKVTKKLFPPSVRLVITECTPAAYMLSANKTVIIDSDMKVIDDSGTLGTDGIPSVSGVSIPSYELNKTIASDSAEKDEALKTMLKAFEATGLLADITYISLDDISEIEFNYANRLECVCGSALELERKIRMFAETINSASMDANSMGTMDLSTPGQAVYLP